MNMVTVTYFTGTGRIASQRISEAVVKYVTREIISIRPCN